MPDRFFFAHFATEYQSVDNIASRRGTSYRNCNLDCKFLNIISQLSHVDYLAQVTRFIFMNQQSVQTKDGWHS